MAKQTDCSNGEKIIELFENLPQKACRTSTLDSGGEFDKHGLQSFFCDPYCFHQKGGVDNTNGRHKKTT